MTFVMARVRESLRMLDVDDSNHGDTGRVA